MTLKQTKARGFTIVELLIVIVVIAILAAITIVAYNGVQQRANNAASSSAANTVMKKIEAANAINTGYPVATTIAAYTTTLSNDPTTTLAGTNITLTTVALLNGGTGKNSVQVSNCGTGAGAKIFFWDYTAGGGAGALTTSPLLVGVTSGTCTPLT